VGVRSCPQRVDLHPFSLLYNSAVTDRILLIEDDARLAEMVSNYLGEAGFATTIARNGANGIALHGRQAFDVLVLDLMLPDMDGLDVCRRIRETSQTPILMLTARGDAMDRVVGLEMGADDYLPKPFEPRELLARLRALLRRAKSERKPDMLRFGRLEIDAGARQVRLDGEERMLTGYQFDLLLALAQHAGRVLSRDTLMTLVKNETLEAFDRSIDVHISRIRAAIEDDPKKPKRVITVRGAGYVFAKNQD
jgi:two-component system phosphate regulon response regulator OmpR